MSGKSEQTLYQADKNVWDGSEPVSAGHIASTSGNDEVLVLAVDTERDQAAVRWKDGELGVVLIEAIIPLRGRAVQEVQSMIKIAGEHLATGDICWALYRAGYRKIEE